MIGLLGDVMLGRAVAEAVRKVPPAELWSEEVRSLCSSLDLVVCNLECCLSGRGQPTRRIRGKPFFFRAPPSAVEALQAIGARAVSLANNHALDYEEEALADTLELLAAAGIAAAGAGRGAEEARRPAVVGAAGHRVGLICVSDHPEEYAAAPGAYGIAYSDLARGTPTWVLDELAALKERCDLVIAFPHWGPNMAATPARWQRRVAAELQGAGADLVAGHSAHVFHGIEWGERGPLLPDLGDALDDYRVDPVLRNDLGVLAIWRPGGGDEELEVVGLSLDFCRTGLAAGADAEWIAARLGSACGELGTRVERLAEGRFRVSPDREPPRRRRSGRARLAPVATRERDPAGRAEGIGAVHGGRLVARALRSRGVSKLFALSGGHLFSIFDGCKQEGIAVVDTRHEQSAGFAAIGWAKATRSPGVCALTAGCGVTNGMSAIATADADGVPLIALGGRAPEMRWGSGSLQEIDHLPFVTPIVKSAATVKDPAQIPAATAAAIDAAAAPPLGPTFVDYPLDVVFTEAEGEPPDPPAVPAAPAERAGEAAALLAGAERPAIMAGTNLYWAHGEGELRALAEAVGIPVFLNGLGRGCLPPDHELFFSRARGAALKAADVALVIGVPLDFRLGFGGSFGEETKLIQLDFAPSRLERSRRPDLALVGDIAATMTAIREEAAAKATRTAGWLSHLRGVEAEKRAEEQGMLDDGRSPLHPMRVYRELLDFLDRDAIVIGDGGDFVSFAGRVMETWEPGCWMDPGPYGCLGAGPGQAIGAKLAHPERQVCLLLGDGAFGFSGMEFDTMARHGLPIVAVMGNNGIWGLEHHPMKFLYGYSLAAELRPETRYDEVVSALGCHGELVRSPDELRPALERAFASGRPALVNVLTDPEIVYPRRANLA